MSFIRVFVFLLIPFLGLQPKAQAWSEAGHHLIAIMAFELLEPAEQEKVLKLLDSHPKYIDDFTPPESISNKNHWLIGTAGYWPDIARSYPEWTRPTWHYELGAALTLGDVANVPDFPGPLPDSATLDTQELHVAQAIALCRRVLANPTEPASSKALAITWLCHLVADSHQPCHAGSLYAEHVFPEGDRGANSISLGQRRNMHSLWDGLLGRRFDEGDIARRKREIFGDGPLMTEAAFEIAREDTLLPSTWLEESRTYARRYVYAQEVLEPITVALRAQGGELEPITLSEAYLKNAGRIAQLRAAQAAIRLARILSQELLVAAEPETNNSAADNALAQPTALKLIAHRGGVVDVTRIENNVAAIEEAIARNYYMIEVDIRESRDGQLIVHHDSTFSRFYSDDRSVADMTWDEIQQLRSVPGDQAPLNFEQFAALCKGKIALMIDTKGPDHSPEFFSEMERILRENDLLDSAIVIGTQQSKDYFKGKAKVGINLAQLQAAAEQGTDLSHYVLFAHGNELDEATVRLAQSRDVTVVPSVNIFHYPLTRHLALAAADLFRLKEMGVTHFQIDSIYDQFLFDEVIAPQIDGVFSEWEASDVKRTDPQGDASGAFDLSQVSARVVGSQVFLKFDTGRKLNLQSGPSEDGTLILEALLPDQRKLSIDFRKRRAVVARPEAEPSAVPWLDLKFVSLPTYATNEFELQLDLAELGIEAGDAIEINFSGSDSLDVPVKVVANQAKPIFANLPVTTRTVGATRIASMNTLRSGLADPQRQSAFKELIEFSEADIYCFNEEWDREKFEAGLQAVFPGRAMNSEWNEGCAVASVHPLERLDVGLERAVAALVRVAEADPVVVISVHFKCCGFDGSPEDQQREQEAEAVAQAIRKIRSGECGEHAVAAGIVVLGDYNLVGSRLPLEVIEGAGMQEYLLRSPITGAASTWQGISPTESFWPGRLDCVTYSPSVIKIIGGYLLNNQILSELQSEPAGDNLVSDHSMLIVDIASTTDGN